jgi:subtilisin inhibitor-like
VTETPSPQSTTTELTIVIEDAVGRKRTWTLTCDPAGGTHPNPAEACAALAANGEAALPPKRKDVACTQVYGGPERATISGTWQGRRVRSSFSRTDGCEIRRWDLLRGLLPPAGR